MTSQSSWLPYRDTVTLSIHVAPHPDSLIALVCDQLADPPEDPFTPELIAVPTRGIERWITQRTATELAARGVGDGICANIGFPSPSRLVRDTLLAVPALAASVVAWDGPALTGHVLAAIDSHIAEPWMRLIQRYIEADHTSNRLTAATKIAHLFSTYARRRPHMIRAWSTGENTGPGGEEIPEGDRWQPLLWRVGRETNVRLTAVVLASPFTVARASGAGGSAALIVWATIGSPASVSLPTETNALALER